MNQEGSGGGGRFPLYRSAGICPTTWERRTVTEEWWRMMTIYMMLEFIVNAKLSYDLLMLIRDCTPLLLSVLKDNYQNSYITNALDKYKAIMTL